MRKWLECKRRRFLIFKCQICGEEFETSKAINTHISRGEKVRLVDYYHKYHPRKDKFTNELIRYKSYDFYFNNDFNSRSNFLQWFVKNLKHSKMKDYCYSQLEKRIKDKSPTHAFSHVELCSLMIPNIVGFEAIDSIKGYQKFCEEKGLINKFIYEKKKVRNSNKPIEIIIDTREQNPLSLDVPTVCTKLEFGDYALKDSELAIERKSLSDFIGTLSGGLERFEKEIQRSGYLVIMIEDKLNKALNYSPPSWIKAQRANGSYIFHKLRYLNQKYDNIQFIFSEGREQSSYLCKKILRMSPKKVKTIDLQWAYDSHLL